MKDADDNGTMSYGRCDGKANATTTTIAVAAVIAVVTAVIVVAAVVD